MKQFYLETDQLTQIVRTLRYVYQKHDNGNISFIKVVDPITNEEITIDEMKRITLPGEILNIATAYLSNYTRVYF